MSTCEASSTQRGGRAPPRLFLMCWQRSVTVRRLASSVEGLIAGHLYLVWAPLMCQAGEVL